MANSERVTNLKKIQISDPFYFFKKFLMKKNLKKLFFLVFYEFDFLLISLKILLKLYPVAINFNSV